MKTIQELSEILQEVHNINSTATMPNEFEFQDTTQTETWFDKYILRYV